MHRTAFLLALAPLLAQEPCDFKKAYDDASRELRQSRDALSAVKVPGPKPAGDLATLKQSLANLKTSRPGDIQRKQQELDRAKQDKQTFDTKYPTDSQTLDRNVANIDQYIKYLERLAGVVKIEEVQGLAPGVALDESSVRAAPADSFHNSAIDSLIAQIDTLKQTIQRQEGNFSDTGQSNQIETNRNTVKQLENELAAARQQCRTDVLARIAGFGKAAEDAGFPRIAISKLGGLGSMRTDLEKAKSDRKALDDRKRDLSAKVDKTTAELDLLKKDTSLKTLEDRVKALEDWTKTDNDRKSAVAREQTAANKVTLTKPDYDAAVADKDREVGLAQELLRQAQEVRSTKAQNTRKANALGLWNGGKTKDPVLLRIKADAANELRGCQPSAVDATRLKWRGVVKKELETRIATERRSAFKLHADRMTALQAHLARWNCFPDVATLLTSIAAEITPLREGSAALRGDVDFDLYGDDPGEVEIAGGPCEVAAVTDDVPSDIVKGTGQAVVLQYFVFHLANASNGLYVGELSATKKRTRCSFVGGGINCQPGDLVQLNPLAGPFSSLEEAQAELCRSITRTFNHPINGLYGYWRGGRAYGLWDAGVGGCKR